MKIAVIGAGVAGLVAAFRLAERFDVTLFEANDYLGGHVNTVTVPGDDHPIPVDTGFIVFNDRTYPCLVRLLDELGVSSSPTSMSFSVCDERTGLEYNGHSLRTLFVQKRNAMRPRFLKMLYDIGRFNRIARNHVACDGFEMTVAEFLRRHRLTGDFATHYLLPMGSAIWSVPMGRFGEFPIGFICEFFLNHGLLDLRNRPTWRVIRGGSSQYVAAIAKRFRGRVRLNTPIKRVRRTPDRVSIEPQTGDAEMFDHVVFACHSDQALRVLQEDATRLERQTLSAFPYVRNQAVLHTDTKLLPRRRAAWASWNYRMRNDPSDRPAIVTYNMSLLQGLSARETYCVTLNDDRIDPSKRIAAFEYEHPVFAPNRRAAQARHQELQNHCRASYCGAYWGNGFHEDGVVSALKVVAALDNVACENQVATNGGATHELG